MEGVTLPDNEDVQQPLKVNLGNRYDPHDDNSLTETQPGTPVVSDREPFNDAVRHGDMAVGYQRNRTLSDYHPRVRPWVRVYAIIMLGIIAGSVGYTILSLFR
jgi:hypothetical protein